MSKIKKPPGLIRYASQEALETGRTARKLRPRVLIYAALIATLLVALVATASNRGSAEVIVLRGLGAPFELRQGLVTNQLRIKVRNRTNRTRSYRVDLLDAPGASLIAPEIPLEVTAHAQRSTTVFVSFDAHDLSRGRRPIRFRVNDGVDFDRTLPYELLGPELAAKAQPRRQP